MATALPIGIMNSSIEKTATLFLPEILFGLKRCTHFQIVRWFLYSNGSIALAVFRMLKP